MKTFGRTIALFVLSAIIAVSAFVYICPMNMPRLAMRTGHDGCTNEISIQNGFGSFDCMGNHVAEAKATIGQVPEIMNLLLALTVVLVVLRVGQTLLVVYNLSVLTRLRQFYERYSTAVKIYWESQLLRFLNLIRSTTVASLV